MGYVFWYLNNFLFNKNFTETDVFINLIDKLTKFCLIKECFNYIYFLFSRFESNFLCAACDRHWEDHRTFFDTERDRKLEGLPTGEDYIPFAEIPSLRNMALSGEARDDSKYNQLHLRGAENLSIEYWMFTKLELKTKLVQESAF